MNKHTKIIKDHLRDFNFRIETARERQRRWEMFCLVWSAIGWAAVAAEMREVMALDAECGAEICSDYIYDRENFNWSNYE